ncbi:MAG: PAS domain-containing protein [Burkholderiaceae bacterium]|jgi:two-component system sensor histidine kinase PilS (NtrC family)|nr:PAS domain-containing protein [Burkholderiaceae bacterium]
MARRQHTWFSAAPPPLSAAPRPASLLAGDADSGASSRMWANFMSARVVVALALLGMHLIQGDGRRSSVWIAALSLTYLMLTALTRVLARPRAPGHPFDVQWLYVVGVDLAFIITLQTYRETHLDYTPLLALPVLMTAVMGTRALALGTAALAALVLLGNAVWNASIASWQGATGILQASLAGAGLLVLSLLTHQLSARLAREQALVRRSRTETRMQSLVNNLVIEAMSDGVLVVDSGYSVRAANPAAHLMLGTDPELTPNPFSLLENPAWTQLTDVVRRTFADRPVDAIEVALHHEDRHGGRLRARTRRTALSGGSAGSLCVMFLQDLREMEARLRTEKLAAMGRMSAAVAHEIRNPLAAISQANALLEEDLSAPAQQRLTAMVRQNAERLGHIVEDVLDVVRVQDTTDAHEMPMLELDQEVRRFCREWLEQHRHQHPIGPRLRMALQAPKIHVQFTREHLRRVLVNLLDNAGRHASAKTDAIQVSTQAVRHGPATLTVWSDGPALDASVLRHLFEPFFSSESRSSGLGLFICRELCQRHGAVIGHERSRRRQGDAAVDGNGFFVDFRRAYNADSRPLSAQEYVS